MLYFFYFFVIFLLSPILVAGKITLNFKEIENGSSSIPVFIEKLYSVGIYIGGTAAVLVLVLGAIIFIVSSATPAKKDLGRELIFGALWGLALLLGSYFILKTVNPTLTTLRDPGGNLAIVADYKSCYPPEQGTQNEGGVQVKEKLPFCDIGEYPRDPKTGKCKCYINTEWEANYTALGERVGNEEDPSTADIINGALFSKGTQCFLDAFGKSPSEVQKNLVTISCAGMKIQVHNLAKSAFESACAKIPANTKTACGGGLMNSGTYIWRQIAGSKSLSNHSFGVALDISAWACGYCDNVSRSNCYDYTNKRICKPPSAQGSCNNPNLPTTVINAFKSTAGFRWGGDYGKKTDNMHFEWLGPCAK